MNRPGNCGGRFFKPRGRRRVFQAALVRRFGLGRWAVSEMMTAGIEIARGRTMLRQAWIAGDFTRRKENALYRRHRKLLADADHVARLDRLLWEGRFSSARRALWRVNKEHRALGEARLLLATMSGNVV